VLVRLALADADVLPDGGGDKIPADIAFGAWLELKELTPATTGAGGVTAPPLLELVFFDFLVS